MGRCKKCHYRGICNKREMVLEDIALVDDYLGNKDDDYIEWYFMDRDGKFDDLKCDECLQIKRDGWI